MKGKLFKYFYDKTIFFTALSFLLLTFSVSIVNGQAEKLRAERQPEEIFTNPDEIIIPDAGHAIPYPSTISVTGLVKSISNTPGSVKVTLNNFNHTYPADVGIVLVGPTGAALLLQDRVTSGQDAVDVTYTISDDGATRLPSDSEITPGTYKPTAYISGEFFPAPGPGTNYANPGPAVGGTATLRSVFGGTNPNGIWRLFIVDFSTGDSGRISGGWSLEITQAQPAPFDFDGDGKTDLSVFRPSDGTWYINRSTDGFLAVNFGISTDVTVAQDYDGDGKTDIAVYRFPDSGQKEKGEWYILRSSDNTVQFVSWGELGDNPVLGDFDGDKKADPAVFRPDTGRWRILKSSDGEQKIVGFGQSGDHWVPADYDGDDITDIAVYRNGVWYLLQSKDGFAAISFGLGIDIDKPVPADYDGDGKDDIAVFRRTEGIWYSLNSLNGQFTAVKFGQEGDVPVPGNYDADDRFDRAVYRNGTWFLLQSTVGFSASAFGAEGDFPVPACPCVFVIVVF